MLEFMQARIVESEWLGMQNGFLNSKARLVLISWHTPFSAPKFGVRERPNDSSLTALIQTYWEAPPVPIRFQP